MAVSVVGHDTDSGGNVLTMALPIGTAIGDLGVLTVGVKPFSAAVTTPAGWTLIGSTTNGSVASGADVGSVKIYTFEKVISSTSENAVVTSSVNNVIIGSLITLTKGSSELWYQERTVFGTDTSHGANYSATGTATVGLTTGDILLSQTVTNSDQAGASHSVAVPGAGENNNFLSSFLATSGDDATIHSMWSEITSGPDNGAPVYTYTEASSTSGATAFTRVRVAPASLTVAFNNSPTAPGFDITVNNLTDATTFGINNFTVTRIDNTAQYSTVSVRGLDKVDPTTSFPVTDYECPFVTSAKYKFEAFDNSNVVFSSIESSNVVPTTVSTNPLITQNFYLKDPTTPARSFAVALTDFTSYSNEGNILGSFHVLGRGNPVIFTDIVEGINGTMTVFTTDSIGGTVPATHKVHRTILSTGDVLFFQSVKYTKEIPDFFFVVTSFTTEHISRPNSQALATQYTISFQEVDRPETLDIAVSSSVWQSVFDDPAFSTWGDVNSTVPSWGELLSRYQ